MPEETWEIVLQNALHSTRSHLCTSTNSTPNERFFRFHRRSILGKSLPNWLLNPGPVFLRNHVRNKGESLGQEVELIENNFSFAHVRFPDLIVDKGNRYLYLLWPRSSQKFAAKFLC